MWFCWTDGSSHVGQLNDLVLLKNKNFSFETFVLTGAFNSFQLGSSSSKALVSKTFPLKICAPISEAFSSKHTFNSGSNCLSLIAVDSPKDHPQRLPHHNPLLL